MPPIELTTDMGRLEKLQIGMSFGSFHHRARTDVDVRRNTERRRKPPDSGTGRACFILSKPPKTKRSSIMTAEGDRLAKNATCGSSGLHGSRRVSSKPLHLSHLGPDCNPADVIRYCKERRVTVTGCYFIRTRIWGTQSAKVYVDDSSLETVLHQRFWPNLVECRRWETTPPANKRLESSKAMVENFPERTSRGKSVPQ